MRMLGGCESARVFAEAGAAAERKLAQGLCLRAAAQVRALYTAAHSQSTRLNYEWRSIRAAAVAVAAKVAVSRVQPLLCIYTPTRPCADVYSRAAFLETLFAASEKC